MSTTATSGNGSLALAGLASGFDWQSLISQLVQVQRAPEKTLRTEQFTLQSQNSALGSIQTDLTVLQNSLANLTNPSFFDSRIATSSDTTLAAATAASGTTAGTYSFNVSQMASAAKWQGTSGVAGPLNATNDVSQLVVGTANFSTPVSAGTFTVNGKQITIATTDTLQSVFNQINTATGGAVTASYSSATDSITLSSGAAITLGSSADTSNFLQVAKLANNGTGTISSSSKLGALNLNLNLTQSNLATAVSDGGSGQGAFTINGVTINFNASTDTLTDVLNRINGSAAGVIASYDQVNNRFTLVNKNTGDLGVTLQDVTGNFLAATNLAAGSLTHGTNLLYTLNNGATTLSSQSNVIGADSSGITGLSVTVLKGGSFQVTVGSDTATIKKAITDFVTAYNKAQATINSQTASTTDATGKVTPGILTGDLETENLNSNLRDLMTSPVSGLSGSLQTLNSLGFQSNGQDDSLSSTDLSGLDSALSTNLSGLKDFFTHSGTGLAVRLNSLLNSTIGTNGSLVTQQQNLTTQSSAIDDQVAKVEAQVQVYQQQMTAEFVAMETAESQTNQQLQYLQRSFSSLGK